MKQNSASKLSKSSDTMAVVRILVVTEGRSAMLDLETGKLTVTAGRLSEADLAEFLRPYLEKFLAKHPAKQCDDQHATTTRLPGRRAGISQLISQAAARYGIDASLVMAIAQRESNLNPNAVSPAGAQGVMQLMPATAAALGVTNPFDAAQNIAAGVRYFAQLLNQFGGDVAKALAPTIGARRAFESNSAMGRCLLGTRRQRRSVRAAIAASLRWHNFFQSHADTPLTIDASTGEVIQDDTPTPAANAPS